MTTSETWSCPCGEEGKGESAAQRHAAVCSLFGAPWTNPAWPRPEPKRGSNHLPATGRCHTCDRRITGERRYCGPCLAKRP